MLWPKYTDTFWDTRVPWICSLSGGSNLALTKTIHQEGLKAGWRRDNNEERGNGSN